MMRIRLLFAGFLSVAAGAWCAEFRVTQNDTQVRIISRDIEAACTEVDINFRYK
jgi:hypothetical protein